MRCRECRDRLRGDEREIEYYRESEQVYRIQKKVSASTRSGVSLRFASKWMVGGQGQAEWPADGDRNQGSTVPVEGYI